MTFSLRTKWSNCSFRVQLFLALTLLTALVTVTFTFFLISYERHSSQQQLRLEGQILATFLARELQLPLYAEQSEELARICSAMFTYKSINAIKVRDGKGRIMADIRRSTADRESEPLTVTEPVVTANRSFSPEAQLLGESPAQSELIGTVQLTLNKLTIAEQMQHFIQAAILIAILFWLTVSVIGFLILKQMTRTISLLLDGIGRIAAGDLSSRIVVKNSIDTERAAATINKLAETLQIREEENHQLQLDRVNSLRLELDEEKTRHMAKLIQTNRMTSLGLLVSSMAHEINNPNGTIRLAGEYLASAWKDAEPLLTDIARNEGDFSLGGLHFSKAQEEIAGAIDSIARSSSRIERVVQNLRSYSLGDRSELRNDVDLNRVTGNSLAIVRAHSRQTAVNIATQLDPRLPLICGNPFQLEQVITNLLLNALQALPPEGSRRVFLTTTWQQHDNSVTLEVRDEGHGIPQEHLPYLCEPFFSTKISMGGSGLGLYIANFIVTEHQGRLEFNSRPGSGCTVIMHLPVKHSPAHVSPSASSVSSFL